MTEIQKQLLSLLKHSLFKEPTDATVTPEIIAEARMQSVSTLIARDNATLAQNLRVINSHAQLTEVLDDIPFTTFKGYASAYYYLQPIYRPMGDVDLIVALENYRSAVEKLISAGYTKTVSEHERHATFRKNKITVELHSEIMGIPNGADGIITDSATAEGKVRGYLSNLIETARTVEIQQGKVIIPDDFHHALIMLLHVAGHLINDGGIGLRHLCDWAVYVNRVYVSKFREQLENIGLWTFACQLTAVSSKYLGLLKQEWAGEWSDEFLFALIEDVLAAGNFGQKEAGRRITLQLEKKSFAEMTADRYPQAKGILLPGFMFVNVLRYGWLIARKKRKFIKPSTFAGAKRRNELYEQFKLFEFEG